MKIQCHACEAAEAKVLCCADEAALCLACDQKIHAANKLAGKHQRVPLVSGPSSSQVPKCDICKEASGYFFCLEDRALLCRKCDIAIHSVNSYVSAHQRFLLTGVKVGPEPPPEQVLPPAVPEQQQQQPPSSMSRKAAEQPSKLQQRSAHPVPVLFEDGQLVSSQLTAPGNLAPSKASYPPAGTLAAGTLSTGPFTSDWPPEGFFDFENFNQNYGFIDDGYSKADSGKLGSSEGSPVYAATGEELDTEILGLVPELSWTVPEIPSPPTASGLNWPKNSQRHFIEDSLFVPDISTSAFENPQGYQEGPIFTKRRRSF